MHTEQRQRAAERLAQAGIERALFTSPYSVTWLTGFAEPIVLGMNPFAGGHALVWYDAGHWTLLALDAHSGLADGFRGDTDATVITYQGYTVQSLDPTGNLQAALQPVLRGTGRGGAVGVERNALPAYLYQALGEALPGATLTPVDGWLVPLRMVKTAEELVALRHNFALTDAGHAAARDATRVGAREIDVWTAVQGAIERKAGYRVPLGNDCIVTYRPGEGNNIGGYPLDYVIHADTALIVDLGTRDMGYWSDSCATCYPVEPTARQQALHRVIRDALDYAVSLVRPGAVAGEIDAQVRDFIRRAGYPVYPHHTGHGVGVSPHEEPRLVPGSPATLQAGMVIMLEPGTYLPGETGIRLEDAVLVTPDGAEVLTTHDKGW